jgi:type II secretory pathway pseudopilin PulG
MVKKKGTRGTTLIALLVVVAVLALAASGVASVGFEFVPDASWAEGV